MTRLGDVLLDVKPGFATGDNLEEGVFQFRMHNLTRESALDLTKRRRVNATVKQLEKQSVAPGDVLFNATNSPELVGKSALIRELDEPAVFSNHFMRLRTDQTRLDPGYLAYFLKFEFVRGVFRSMAKAWVNQATIGRDRLESLEIPLPPLPEQRRIAAILDHADALRAKRRQVLADLDALTQSVFNDMFDASRERIPLGKALSDCPVFTDGDWVESKDQDPGGDVRLTQLADVGDGRWIDKSSRFLTSAKAAELRCTFLEAGDVLVARMPDPLGRACIFPGSERPSVTVVDVCIIRPHAGRHTPTWLMAAINSPATRSQIARLATGTTRSRVSRGNLAKVTIPVVSIDEQEQFAERVRQVNSQEFEARSALTVHEALFASLQSRAFRGEL